MSVTCKTELRCSLVGLVPVSIPFSSFNRIPGAKVAIKNENWIKTVYFFFLLVFNSGVGILDFEGAAVG
jgi:hypothetical protein